MMILNLDLISQVYYIMALDTHADYIHFKKERARAK